MTRDIRCPHCRETFVVGGATDVIDCAACGKEVRLQPATPASPAVAVASPAPAPPPAKAGAPRKAPVIGIKKSCPSCGAKYEGNLRKCPGCGASYRVAKAEQAEARETEASGFGPEKAGIRKGVLGGLIMIVIAVVWFGVGWAAGRIFFYPPVLFVIGLYALIKGLATGNYAGTKAAARRGRR